MMYDTDDNGRCVPSYVASEYNEEIDIYYQQRAVEMERLHNELLSGAISPISFFVQYQSMVIGDVAKRVGLRAGQVQRHMTPEGFRRATVEQLMRYAKVFDVTVSDFFELSYLADDIETEVSKHHDRLLLQTTFSVKKTHG